MRWNAAVRVCLVVGMFCSLSATPARALVIDLSARNSAGISIDGLNAADRLELALIDNSANGGFIAWNAWGSTNCTDPAGCEPGSTGWLNLLAVVPGSGGAAATYGVRRVYPTPAAALAAFTPVTITGSTSYLFAIPDDIFGDNVGGLSIKVDVTVPAPSSGALMLLGLLGVAGRIALLRRRRDRATLR